ncbi:MAG: cation:proton antiporter [Deltaproteobacteria bacterium]|nr:cation:proton antiporter [Deltaproteobacteria bacterium]
MLLLTSTIFMAFVRLMKGPSFPDRVVALDIMTTVAMGLIGLYAMESGEVIFLDVALFLALVSFLGTVAFAYYVERRQLRTGSGE